MHYTEQTSWVLFLKFLDDYEAEKEDEAVLSGIDYQPVLAEAYRWSTWACPKVSATKSTSFIYPHRLAHFADQSFTAGGHMTHSKHDYWLEQFNAWQASKLTIKDFCLSLSLNYDQFNYWRRKFLAKPSEGSDSGFVKVVPRPQSAIRADHELVMHLPSGIRLSGLHAGNVDVVAALLRAL